MKAIFLLIALYTIAGKDAQPSGDIPAGASYEYTQTGSRSGQMTAGTDILLRLYGYTGCTLQSVALEMKSSTSAGAGALSLSVGDEMLWTIADAPFNAQTWAGAFSTDWVEITHDLSGRTVSSGEEIQLHLTASANSLYLQSVAITYTAPEAQAYTVQFRTHVPDAVASLTESQPGAGVVLPEVPIEDDVWMFMGWRDQPLLSTQSRPDIYPAGVLYHPTADCTLHAVFQTAEEDEYWWPADSITDGDYLITMLLPDAATLYQATGEVSSGRLASIPYYFYSAIVDPLSFQMPYNEDGVYTLTWRADSTLNIKHKASSSYVLLGASSKFVKTASGSPWQVRAQYDATMQMTFHQLWASYGLYDYMFGMKSAGDGVYFQPLQSGQDPWLLLYALSDEPSHVPATYTSYPYGRDDEHDALLPIRTDGTTRYTLPFGPAKLIIQNGQKTLQINE